VRALGPSRDVAGDACDIVVRFVPRLPDSPALTRLGTDQAAYDAETFYLVDPAGGRVAIDLTEAGATCRITAELRVTQIPLLIPLIALRLIALGRVLVHAASFSYRGVGVLVAGWEGGGKTEMLLPFVRHGARYLADEWTIVGDDGQLRGLGGHAQLWDWQLRQLPELGRRVPAGARVRARAAAAGERLARRAATNGGMRARVGGLLEAGFHNNARISGAPAELFDGAAAFDPVPLDRAFLATVVAGSATRVRPIEPDEFAARIAGSLAFERRPLLEAYDAFRFAFPGRRSAAIEGAADAERELLAAALRSCRTYAIEHPKPLVLDELFHAARPLCEP
jgi:hypothetical protein